MVGTLYRLALFLDPRYKQAANGNGKFKELLHEVCLAWQRDEHDWQCQVPLVSLCALHVVALLACSNRMMHL